MYRLVALLTLLAGLLVAPAASAGAASTDTPGWSADITTTKTVAYGSKIPAHAVGLTGPRQYWRPHFFVKVAVRCPAGESASLVYSPMSGNQSINSVEFTCTGATQTITAWPAGGKGKDNVGVELFAFDPATFTRLPRATDSAIVTVTAVIQHSDCFCPCNPC
jgi:hypothetical protein